jgi:putative redox protein
MGAMKTVIVDWQPEQARFEARGGHAGQVVHMNAPHAEGGATGFSPAEMLLAGAGGCSAWDVVEILHKQRQRVTAIRVVVRGEHGPEPPHPYVRVHVEYDVSGHHLNEAKVRRAVELSEQRYCSVIATIRGVAEVVFDVHVHEAEDGATTGSGRRSSHIESGAAGAPTVEATVALHAPD